MKILIRMNMKWRASFAPALALLLVLAAGAALAQQSSAAKQAPGVKMDIKETKLKNGLRVITVEDRRAPVISLALTYNVGAANERKGRTGFAHLFEHMMFKGSENTSAGEHLNLVLNNGGLMDATTGADRTNYYASLPSNQLELPLFLEADRMRSLSITQEALDTERHVVQEERRMRIDNQPYGKSREILNGLLYDNFAYKHPGIGSMEDLNAASLEDIRDFFRTYYAPNNAVLTLVGDFKTADAIAKIKKYFEDIPRQPAPPPLDLTEPEQKAERRATVEDALARVPQVSIAFKAAPGNTPDFYALQSLSSALAGGQSSRLYQKLVKEKEMVNSVSGFVDERRGPGALYITATLRPGKKVEEVEAAIYEEIERLEKEPITGAELEKAKNAISLSFINNLQRSLLRAIIIGQYAVSFNDLNLINTWLDKIAACATEDLQRVANKYLRPTNRTVVITLPKSATP
ncbi:MAG: M16 family metallopeptidase [Blastocatellia bacterium]